VETSVSRKPYSDQWKTVWAWCPLCWWKLKSEFILGATDDGIEKRMKAIHTKEKPNCKERVRVVIGENV
jgi:hypothetical protein